MSHSMAYTCILLYQEILVAENLHGEGQGLQPPQGLIAFTIKVMQTCNLCC